MMASGGNAPPGARCCCSLVPQDPRRMRDRDRRRPSYQNQALERSVEPNDGHPLLVCRYRPRRRAQRRRDLGHRVPTAWARAPAACCTPTTTASTVRRSARPSIAVATSPRMKGQWVNIGSLAARVAAGEAITLLGSSACTDPERCGDDLALVPRESRRQGRWESRATGCRPSSFAQRAGPAAADDGSRESVLGLHAPSWRAQEPRLGFGSLDDSAHSQGAGD